MKLIAGARLVPRVPQSLANRSPPNAELEVKKALSLIN